MPTRIAASGINTESAGSEWNQTLLPERPKHGKEHKYGYSTRSRYLSLDKTGKLFNDAYGTKKPTCDLGGPRHDCSNADR